MYFVQHKSTIGYTLCKFETLEEAKQYVNELAEKGHREFYLSQEIPMKIKVEVEI